jgi:hypothetical protein
MIHVRVTGPVGNTPFLPRGAGLFSKIRQRPYALDLILQFRHKVEHPFVTIPVQFLHDLNHKVSYTASFLALKNGHTYLSVHEASAVCVAWVHMNCVVNTVLPIEGLAHLLTMRRILSTAIAPTWPHRPQYCL